MQDMEVGCSRTKRRERFRGVSLPIPSVRSRGSRGLQSLFLLILGRLWASFLPFRPGFYPNRRVFRSTRPVDSFESPCVLSCPSTPPQRLSLSRAAWLPMSPADPEPRSPSTSLNFPALQHFQTEVPFFSTPLVRERSRFVALNRESRAFRVWLPS
jgi:hypothetical protein